MTMKIRWSKPMGCSKSSSKREIYSNKIYLKKQEKSQVNNLHLHLNQLEKEEEEEQKKLEEEKKS